MKLRTTCALAAVAGALALSGCTRTGAAAGGQATAPAATVIGQPVSCVQTRDIHDTKVYDNSTIDFRMRNGTVYRNTLPNSCPTLASEGRFAYKVSIGQLCDIDTITVLPLGSSIPGPTCGLGKFVPVQVAGR